MAKPITWSYSSLSLYQQCPKKYYHLKVAKDIKEPLGEAIIFGNEIHKIAEEYVGKGLPIPEKYSQIEPALKSLRDMPGKKLCENKLGLTAELEPCGFFDKNVWWRGVADIIILQGDTALTVDYKTGKSSKYAELKQLEIVSLAIFKHFPEIKKVKGGLLFVIANAFLKDNYHVDQQDVMWSKWIADRKRMAASYANNVWNARPSGLCRNHCVVLSCPHNGRN
jgi:hypothetical protein